MTANEIRTCIIYEKKYGRRVRIFKKLEYK